MTAETTETRANPTADNLAKIDAWMQRLADETDQAAQSAELTRYLTGSFHSRGDKTKRERMR